MSENLPFPLNFNSKIYNIFEISYKRNNNNNNIFLTNNNNSELIQFPTNTIGLKEKQFGEDDFYYVNNNSITIKKTDTYMNEFEVILLTNGLTEYTEIQVILFINDEVSLFRNETITNNITKYINITHRSIINKGDNIYFKLFAVQENFNIINIELTEISWIIKNI